MLIGAAPCGVDQLTFKFRVLRPLAFYGWTAVSKTIPVVCRDAVCSLAVSQVTRLDFLFFAGVIGLFFSSFGFKFVVRGFERGVLPLSDGFSRS